jgi:hypothetical protein
LQHGPRYPYKADFLATLKVAAERCLTDDRLNVFERIMEEYRPTRDGGLMILTEHNAKRSFQDFWCRPYAAVLAGRPTYSFNCPQYGKWYYIYVNLNLDSPEFGYVLVTYKERLLAGQTRSGQYARVNNHSRFSDDVSSDG